VQLRATARLGWRGAACLAAAGLLGLAAVAASRAWGASQPVAAAPDSAASAVADAVGEEALPRAGPSEMWASLDLRRLNKSRPVQELPPYTLHLRSWHNRGQMSRLYALMEANASVDEIQSLFGAQATRERRLSTNCGARLGRLGQVTGQRMGGGRDALFPATEASIAPPGSDCGDSAAGISEPCSKYDHWRTMKQVANYRAGKRSNKKQLEDHEVIAQSGPNFHDVGQGELGTCYFLAGLASIANTDPEVINKMFVNREKWSQGIYTTKWLINGKETLVEVNNMVPAMRHTTYFVQPSSSGEWWPVILEKAWAKIFGNFKATEAGWWPSAVLAMTMAPVSRCHHDEFTADVIFKKLEHATQMKWPMGAGTSSQAPKYGLVTGHAYSVLKAYNHPSHGKVVHVYNPWHSDGYKGKIRNPDKDDGEFTMTIAEYKDAFGVSSWSRVHNDYKVTSKKIQSEHEKVSAWDFHIDSPGTFYVSVNWPSERIVEPCEMKDPKVNLAVVKKGLEGSPIMGIGPSYGITSAHAMVQKGPGDYTVTASISFPDKDFVHEVHLVVYAPEHVQISESSQDAKMAMLNMYAPTEGGQACKVIFIPHRGIWQLKEDKVVHGIPTYWSADGADVAYYVAQNKEWWLIGKSYWDKIAAGGLWSYEKLEKSAMTCGCRDSPDGVAGFHGVHCNEVKGSSAKYSNVKCHGVEHSKLVQRYCSATCEADFCTKSAPTKKPKPPPPVNQKCEDHAHTGITLDNNPASCSELAEYCHEYESVQEKCCETCAQEAEDGGMSNEQECVDHTPPGIRDNHGYKYKSCSELKGQCEEYDIIRERCCKTCKAETHVDAQCTDSEPPNLLLGGKTTSCPRIKKHCGLPFVKAECCKTCR